MMKVTFKTDLRRLDAGERKLPSSVAGRMWFVAHAFREIIRENWSPVSPSDPGNPPAVVSGRLDRSIIVEKTGRDSKGRYATAQNATAWAVLIGNELAYYAEILEEGSINMDARPFVAPAIKEISDIVGDEVAVGVREAFR